MRLAAFDMDGTLLMPDHRIGAETLEALRHLARQRVMLTFATGRHFLEVSRMTQRLGLHGHLITGNGTRVHDRNGKLLFRQDLAPDVVHELLHVTWSDSASVHLFRDDGWLTGHACPELLILIKRMVSPIVWWTYASCLPMASAKSVLSIIISVY